MRGDRTSGRETGEGGSLSRRTFVLAGGTVAAGVVGTTGRGRAEGSGRSLDVAVTVPYLRSVRDAVAADDRLTANVEPTAVDDDRADVFDGGVEVLVSGRPIEGGRAANGVAVDRRAALTHRDREWRECLCRSEVRDRWADGVPVEAWSETGRDGWTSTDSDPAGVTSAVGGSDAASTVLVRGTREYQYTRGRGGVGYYGVDRDEIVNPRSDSVDGARTPLVRLGYVHSERNDRSDDRVATFLRRYRRHAGDTGNAPVPFPDPAVGRRRGGA